MLQKWWEQWDLGTLVKCHGLQVRKSTVRTWFNGVIRETLEGGAVSEEAVTVQQHNCKQQKYNSFRLYPRLHSFPSDKSDPELDMQEARTVSGMVREFGRSSV